MRWSLADVSIKVCCHIYNFEFAYEINNIFLSNDLELLKFKQSYRPNPLRYFIQIVRIFYTLLTSYCKVIEDWKPKLERLQNLHFPE